MFRTLRSLRPSPAMIVALLALAVALGGTSYAAIRLPAGSVTTKTIKNGAVTRAKIKNNAINSSKIADRSLTSADIADNSLTGADINPAALATMNVPQAANSDHAGAAAALDKVNYRTVQGSVPPAPSIDTSAHALATAGCDPGQRVIGGGVKVDDLDNQAVIDSYADAGGTAWSGNADNGDIAAAHGFTVYAVCITAVASG